MIKWIKPEHQLLIASALDGSIDKYNHLNAKFNDDSDSNQGAWGNNVLTCCSIVFCFGYQLVWRDPKKAEFVAFFILWTKSYCSRIRLFSSLLHVAAVLLLYLQHCCALVSVLNLLKDLRLILAPPNLNLHNSTPTLTQSNSSFRDISDVFIVIARKLLIYLNQHSLLESPSLPVPYLPTFSCITTCNSDSDKSSANHWG